MSKFAEIHRRSIEDAAEFWAEAAEGIEKTVAALIEMA